MIGYLELIDVAHEFVLVQGWAPNRSFEGDSRIRLLGDDALVGEVAVGPPLGRPDLEPVGGRMFRVLMPARVGIDRHFTALLGGVELNSTALTVRRFAATGRIDRADRRRIEGWVFNPAAHPLRWAMLVVDGVLRVPLEPLVVREDLAQMLPQRPPTHGFGVDVQAMLPMIDPDRLATLGLSIEVDGVTLDSMTIDISQRHLGKLEYATPQEVRGWATDVDDPEAYQPVEMKIDGVSYATTTAHLPRIDLLGLGFANSGGGFAFELPRHDLGLPGGIPIRVGFPGARRPLPGGERILDGAAPVDRRWQRGPRSVPVGTGRPRVAIVVPIYNAADDLRVCVAAVLRHTSGDVRLILIDDCSTDPDVAAVLSDIAEHPAITIVRNDRNIGFTGTVNIGLDMADGRDVVLLNSDTVVTPGWLTGLWLAAYADDRIATASAVSDNAGAFSVPDLGVLAPWPEWLKTDDRARLVRQESLVLRPEVPTGHGFCLYIRRTAIDAVGRFDQAAFPEGYGEENDFCMRADRAGFLNVVDDRTFIQHRGSASFGARKERLLAAGKAVLASRYPDYKTRVGLLETGSDLLAMRWRVRRALALATPDRPVRPRALFVVSTQTGGTPQTNRDLMAGVGDAFECWLLHCDTRVIMLSRMEDGVAHVVETVPLQRRIDPRVHRSPEYDSIMGDLLVRHAIELVHLRHIAWHGLGLIDLCETLDVPVVFSFHDFYTICPSVKLLDQDLRYCDGICTPGPGECGTELWSNGSFPNLKHEFVHVWRAMLAGALAKCSAFVTTSVAARDTIAQALSLPPETPFHIVEHGRDFARFGAAPPIDPGSPMRILVPGNISIAKGALIIEEMAAIDRGQNFEFHILGEPGRLQPGAGIVLHGNYERDQFLDRVADIAPHIGAILSIWAETYCHTLTELWAAGLPVVGFDIGAVGRRIGDTGGGWLRDLGESPDTLAAFLADLAVMPEDVAVRAELVRHWQVNVAPDQTVAAMAERYVEIYDTAIASKRAFAPQARSAATN